MRHTTIRFALLLSLAACGPTPTPEAVIRAWADATQARDYATAESLMTGDGFAKMTWREPHTRYHRAGRLQQYAIIGEPVTTGASTTATLCWTGNSEPMCITVQVDQAGKLTPLSDYDRCEVTP